MANILLDKLNRIGGDTFKLPSRGVLYTSDVIDDDVIDGEIIIKPVKLVDELALRNHDMLFQGTAIEQAIKSCAPQIKDPMKLLATDVDFILTCLKFISHGNNITISHTCKSCDIDDEIVVTENGSDDVSGENDIKQTKKKTKKNKATGKEKKIDIPLNYFINNTKFISNTDIEKMKSVNIGNFCLNLKPAIFKDVIALNQTPILNEKLDPVELANFAGKTAINYILDVDGISDRDSILEWFLALPPIMRKNVLEKINDITNWGIKFNYDVDCSPCGTERVSINLNPQYVFMMPSDQEIQLKSTL